MCVGNEKAILINDKEEDGGDDGLSHVGIDVSSAVYFVEMFSKLNLLTPLCTPKSRGKSYAFGLYGVIQTV